MGIPTRTFINLRLANSFFWLSLGSCNDASVNRNVLYKCYNIYHRIVARIAIYMYVVVVIHSMVYIS